MSILAGSKSKTWAGAIFVVSVAAVLYFLTAARDIVVGDTPELITAAATLGVAHEPGYPLFTMLGHFFSVLPFGSIPFRVNLLSAVCDALTVGVIYFVALHLTRSRLAAALAGLLLAVNRTFWTWSLAAEVFPLNNFLAAALILLLVMWNKQPERAGLLIAAFFVAGLGLTNHQTIVLLAPSFCFVLWQRRSILFARPRLLAIGIAAFVIGLIPYAYVPWASAHHPAHNWGNVSSLRDLLGVISRKSYGSTRLVTTAGYAGGSPWARLAALGLSFGPVTGLLIISGAIQAFQRARWYFWFSLIAFIFAGLFFIWITGLNLATAPSALFVLQRFFLLPQVVLAPLAAFGVLALARFVSRSINAAPSLGLRIVAATCLTTIAITVATNYRRIDQSRNFIERRFAEDVFATIERNSILLARGDIAFALLYFQQVEGVERETELVLLPLLATKWYIRQLQQEHPNLITPFDRYDPVNNNLKKFVEANNQHTICIVGTIGDEDHSLDSSYWAYQRGLLLIVEPRSKNIPLQGMIEENARLFNRYHLPAANSVRTGTFENDILTAYAWPAFRIGTDCARVGLSQEARRWYERALDMKPNFSQARDALARLEH
jgi:tetratricopeptide (TPR) repeat protein